MNAIIFLIFILILMAGLSRLPSQWRTEIKENYFLKIWAAGVLAGLITKLIKTPDWPFVGLVLFYVCYKFIIPSILEWLDNFIKSTESAFTKEEKPSNQEEERKKIEEELNKLKLKEETLPSNKQELDKIQAEISKSKTKSEKS